MKEIIHVITDAQGIHARPAGELVKLCSGFQSQITIKKDEKSADAKRIFGIMSLAAKQGETIVIQVTGEDEDEAARAIEKFLEDTGKGI